MATKKDIEIRTNSAYRLEFQWLNKDGSAKDLTGCTVNMQIRDEEGGVILYGSWAVGSGFVLDAPNGTISLIIPKTETETFNFPYAVYDIIVTWPDTNPDTVLYGDVILRKGVTV